jgi:hypothetical protein
MYKVRQIGKIVHIDGEGQNEPRRTGLEPNPNGY